MIYKLWILVFLMVLPFVSSDQSLRLNSSFQVLACDEVSSVTLDVIGSPVEESNPENYDDGCYAFGRLNNESTGNSTGKGQSVTIYNRQISSLGFYILIESAETPSGNLTYRFRNISDYSVIFEEDLGDLSNDTKFPVSSYYLYEYNVTSPPTLDGQYLMTIERDNVSYGDVRVLVSSGDNLSTEQVECGPLDPKLGEGRYFEFNKVWSFGAVYDHVYRIGYVEEPYPINPRINLTGTSIWNLTGNFNGTNTTDDFSDELNSQLVGCSPNVDGYCDFYLSFWANNTGVFSYDLNLVTRGCGVYSPIAGGGVGSVEKFLFDWNQELYLQLKDSWDKIILIDNYKELPKNLWNFTILFFKYVLRQPGTLTNIEEIENV